MADAPQVRFSTANVAKSEAAKAFPWEQPVPKNHFWDSIGYSQSRQFLSNFTDEELAQLPIDPNSEAPNAEKLNLLLVLLQKKLETEESNAPKPLREAKYALWFKLVSGIFTMQSELGRLDEAERTIRAMVDANSDENEKRPQHMLANFLIKVGKYAEAEVTERPVLLWMENREHLGKDSPQAINARRIIAKALWGQGPSRRAEAEELVAEVKGIVDGMGDGKFGVYQDEERNLNRGMMVELEAI